MTRNGRNTFQTMNARQLLTLAILPLAGLGLPSLLAAPSVFTNNAGVQSYINVTWTNTSTARIQPPGPPYKTDLGVLAFGNIFESSFLSLLSPVVSDGIQTFPLTIYETNTTPRQRIYLNATSGLVQACSVPTDYNVATWVTNTYGEPPAWLTGSSLDQWYVQRDPARQQIGCVLIATNNIGSYETSLTNRSHIGTTQASPTTLQIYSNDIAIVGLAVVSGHVELYLHAPSTVTNLDLFVSTNLVGQQVWYLLATLPHGNDPLFWSSTFNQSFLTFGLANADVDSDGDGIPDDRETLLYGTDPHKADTDDDQLSDGVEILRFGLNPHLVDTDNDGMSDVWEVMNGLNPTVNDAAVDTDGDGFSNLEEYKRGMNPQLAADGFALYLKTREAIAAKYALVMPSTLVLTNAPGSVADRQDVANALNAMSNRFYKMQ